jgi:sulfate transport system substrate-binding protein
MYRIKPLAVVLSVLVSFVVVGCGTGSSASGSKTLTLVAYSTPREAYDEIIPAFEDTEDGKDVSFETSYGASGEQSRAVVAGLEADVVAFSLASDVTRLVKEGLVDEDWADDEFKGMVTDSVVVFVVRDGNPKNIQTWDDLIKDGVEVITPNPFTSGGARWNIMAAYGAQLELGKSHDEAVDYLRALVGNTPVQDKSAREALQTFVGGKGDVMLAYENEAITAQQKGEKVEYVIPDQTILIENPVAVISESEHKAEAEAFVAYLRSADAQAIFAEKGYRPVLASALDATTYPAPATLFTIDDLGGWTEVTDTFFNPESGIMVAIEEDRGVPVE